MCDLVGHDRAPSASWSISGCGVTAAVSDASGSAPSLQTIASRTGLSRSAVQAAVRHLARRQLVRAERASATAAPVYVVEQPWRRVRDPGATL